MSAVAGAGAFTTYPYVFTGTEFNYKKTKFNELVLAKSSTYLTSYSPPPMVSGYIRQTLF